MNMKKLAACWMLLLPFLNTGAKGDDILPKTPEGWKYERLAFPLSFAPDIAYKGYEELRFAPGMFNAKSDTYFTYIFAMNLADLHQIDATFLKNLLTKYYRGLCQTVWGEDKPKPDFSSITVDIKASGSQDKMNHFEATIHMIDAFVTRKPLRLKLDIQTLVDAANSRTLIFAKASPKPKDHNVWKLLRSFVFAKPLPTAPKSLNSDGK